MLDMAQTVPGRTFFVVDLGANGEVHASTAYQYQQLEQIGGAAELIVLLSSLLWQSPREFEANISISDNVMDFRWAASAETAGIATLRCAGKLVSLSLLACGMDPEADRITLQAFQQHLVRQLHDTGFEPSFALVELAQRPLVATINFWSPAAKHDQLVAALADRCFAAAYFRHHGLA
jgi:hypothetical protein